MTEAIQPILWGPGATSSLSDYLHGPGTSIPAPTGMLDNGGPSVKAPTGMIQNSEGFSQVYKTPKLTGLTEDYDMAGYIANYGVADQSKGQHLTDEFKQPSHITFSTESKYSTPGQQGGVWDQNPNSTWNFRASAHNMSNYSAQEMQDYFTKYEKGNTLILPNRNIKE